MTDERFEILKVEEAAELLKVDLQTIYRMIRRKELPAFRVGRCWRINARDLEKFCRPEASANSGMRHHSKEFVPPRDFVPHRGALRPMSLRRLSARTSS